MKKYFYLIIKVILFFISVSGLFYVLEYGPSLDFLHKLFAPLLLATFTTVFVFKPVFSRFGLIFAISCLGLMILLNLFNLNDLSSQIGGFGFSLLIITISLYFPQIIKKGRIEKF